MPGIIVGIDGSVHSRRALQWALNEASIRHTPLTVLTVSQAVAGYSGSAVSYPGDQERAEKARDAAQEETDSVLETIDTASRPPSVTVQAVSGLPSEALLEAAAGADMLVVGSRGAGGFKRLLLGSVSSQVSSHAQCPVVVIPGEHLT
ncbi:MAG TPA: universal stress protein [Trebonia sp.]|nr:universal stress protein [Trebonia sp.]